MRRFPALVVTCLAPCAALADPCLDRAVAILMQPADAHGPFIASADALVGGQASVTEQYFVSDAHYLAKTIVPTGMPDTLHYMGGTYAPQGDGWTLLYKSEATTGEGANAARQQQADAITAATCGTEEVAGRMLDRIEVAIGPVPVFEKGLRYTWWVTPEDRREKLHMAYELNGMETAMTSTFTYDPAMTLPIPEGQGD